MLYNSAINLRCFRKLYEDIKIEHGEFYPIPPIPVVGDSVEYQQGGGTVTGKVISRHFAYLSNQCCINHYCCYRFFR